MTLNRWPEIENIVHRALERPAGDRRAFVEQACREDPELLHEVISLLRIEKAAEHFIEASALEALASEVEATDDLLPEGYRIGPYTLISLLGRGGMGEVYRARDRKLGREVAVKAMPASFALDLDRVRRLGREAQLLASLNHPNIGAIYGIEEAFGMQFLILELVEGQTLEERLRDSGGLPVREALDVASQIASALEAAHAKSVVHRDLKPSNVRITPEGRVKVLDFGLAKALQETDMRPSTSPVPGPEDGDTVHGAILGTPAYMSPEQARGETTDARADVWAFGCVLGEMLSGRQAFKRDTPAGTRQAVLEDEPGWDDFPAGSPPALRDLVKRCLEKDLQLRLQHMGDVRTGLERARAETEVRQSETRSRWQRDPDDRFEAVFSDDAGSVLAISPTGDRIVFTSSEADRRRLWLRALRSTSKVPLEGTDDAVYPFWSPDGRSVAFFAHGQLRRIDIQTAKVWSLAEAPFPHGGTWGDSGILFAPRGQSPICLLRDTESGVGEIVPVTRLDRPGERGHVFPRFLPGCRHFIYYAIGGGHMARVWLGSLDGNPAEHLLDVDRVP